MHLPRWARLREATAASANPQLQRGKGGPPNKTAGDGNGTRKDCPDCTDGKRADGTTCPTCKGAGTILRESGELAARIAELEGSLATTTERLREAGAETLGATYAPITAATTAAGARGYEVVLIREGLGNNDDSRFYTKHAVQELVSSGVCEGMQAYADHPSLDEEEFLPERSVRDMVGSYSNVHLAESAGGLAEARAVFVPVKGNGYEWVESLAEAAVGNRTGKPLVGISLYGAAAGEDRTRPDGSFGPMADLIRPTSGDIVTNAGAGGEFVRRLMESARAKRASNNDTKGSAMKLDELKAKMAESAKKLREAGTDAERKTAVDELDTLAKAEVEVETPEPKLDGLTVEKLQESAPALLSTIRESAKAEVKIPTTAPEADAALKTENEQLTTKLRESEAKVTEKDKTIADTNAALVGIKVLREAKVAQEDVEFYLAKIREAGASTEDAMKAVIEAEQAREQRIVQRVRESAGLDFVEGNPGSAGKPGETGLLDLSEDGVPMVEPEKPEPAAAAA